MTITHCPRCGAALVVTPRVGSVTVHRDSITLTFNNVSIDHECREEDA